MEKTDIKDVSIEMNAATLKPSVYMMVIHLEGGNVQVQRLKKIKN
jgi:hypothetical protein